MTAGVAHHLVRRAVDITQQHYNGDNGEQSFNELGKWPLIVILATGVAYMAIISMVGLLATLPEANNRQG